MTEHIGTSQNPNLDMEIAPHSAQNAYWWQEKSYQKEITNTLQQENYIKQSEEEKTGEGND